MTLRETTELPGLLPGLYPYQKEDVLKLWEEPSILIANEMGTGKTYQAICLDLVRRQIAGPRYLPTLIVAPLSTLESTWAKHLDDLAPDLDYYVINPKKREYFVNAVKGKIADVYVCHWEALRLMPELQQIRFFHIIADEVHRAKSRKAQQTRALKKLKTVWKTGLSGTPVTNKPADLWSILNWLYPRDFRSYWKFYERFVDFDIVYPHGYHKIKGPKNERILHEWIDPFYVRHLKLHACCEHHPKGVLEELPEKYTTELWVDLHPKQRRAYDAMAKDMIAWLEQEPEDQPLVAPVVIAKLIRLQQFASAYIEYDFDLDKAIVSEPSSKLDALMDIINDNEEEQIVVFSGFKQVINLAAERLQRNSIDYVRITGDVKPDERRRAVEDFQAGKARIFLGTIGAGGEGITLTASSTVVFIDRDWSPAKNSQAEDRLHRVGQKNAVQVVNILARDTVDIGKRAKLEMKKDWIRRILGDA